VNTVFGGADLFDQIELLNFFFGRTLLEKAFQCFGSFVMEFNFIFLMLS